MRPEDYRAKGIQPPLETLPDIKEYFKSKGIRYANWKDYVGRRIKFLIGDSEFEGVMSGLEKSAAVAISPSVVVQPWVIRLSSGDDILFHPEGAEVTILEVSE